MQNTSNKKHTADKKMLREISQEVFHDPSDVNYIFLFLLIYFFFYFEIPRWGFLRAWLGSGRSMGGGAWLPLILGKKEKGLQTEKKLAGQGTKYHPPPPYPCELNSQFSGNS